MSDQTPYYLAFSQMLGIGPMKFADLVSRFQTPQKAYQAPLREIQEVVGAATGLKFDQFRQKFDPKKALDQTRQKNIHVLTIDMPQYPESLRSISDPPICLYLKGDREIFKDDGRIFFAIVGTRHVTDYGRQLTKMFASGLAEAGFIIVSGMALGIDAIAHWACIGAGSKTVAVLGCGVDIIYPRENANLYNKIIETNGAIISEFPPGMTTLPGFFVSRNRLVSGLSRGVLVVEGAKQSGTLITARYAAEQGRDVFAPPSPITSAFAAAPNILLKQGAKLVTEINDIIEEYGLALPDQSKEIMIQQLEGVMQSIAKLLLSQPETVDELAKKLATPIRDVLNNLTLLELNGSVAKNSQGQYYLK